MGGCGVEGRRRKNSLNKDREEERERKKIKVV